MEDREAWYQTYLVKELVLGQVPDVLWLIHRIKNSGKTESPLVLMTPSTWSCPSPSCKAQLGCSGGTLGNQLWPKGSKAESVDIRKVPAGFPETLSFHSLLHRSSFRQILLRVYKNARPCAKHWAGPDVT